MNFGMFSTNFVFFSSTGSEDRRESVGNLRNEQKVWLGDSVSRLVNTVGF